LQSARNAIDRTSKLTIGKRLSHEFDGRPRRRFFYDVVKNALNCSSHERDIPPDSARTKLIYGLSVISFIL